MQKSKIKNQNDTSITTSVVTPTSGATKVPKKTSKEPTSMEELLSQTGYELHGWKRGTVIEGTVLEVNNRRLRLDIGGKSEAIVHEKEMPFITDLVQSLKVGDTINVQVVNPENDRGQTVVSLRRLAAVKRWEMLADKMKKNEVVEVLIRELSKGGFLVDYMGMRGFIPLSQVDNELTKLGDKASGRRVNVKIIEVDKDSNRLVFSQGSGGISEKQKEALKNVEIGKTYAAEVTGIAPFGAFVSVKVAEGINLPGLIHISEIAWEKVTNTTDYLKNGQHVEVKVIGADPKIGKLTLSLKQLLADPWLDVVKVFSIDQQVSGRVSRISQFGVFVSLLPGIDGLIHISKIAPGEEPKMGEDIECVIEEINPDKRKINLSLVSHAKPIGYR